MGNIPSTLDSAQTCVATNPCSGGATINSGNQTVPLLRAPEFLTKEADLAISKSDAPDPIGPGSLLTYAITVTNNSVDTVAGMIIVTQQLDPHTVFASATMPFCSGGEGNRQLDMPQADRGRRV